MQIFITSYLARLFRFQFGFFWLEFQNALYRMSYKERFFIAL
jgi:hypothetical protein